MDCIVNSQFYRNLSFKRRQHSQGVARMAEMLCRRHGIDPRKGTLAGLAHDLAREMKAADILRLAAGDGRPISPLEKARPTILHGRAAAAILREELRISDPEVLEAVTDHVIGRPGMGLLSKIIYVADFLETGRDFINPAFRRRVLQQDMDTMLLAVLEEILNFLKQDCKAIAPEAIELREELLRRVER